jgi:hypothetical protein
VPDIAGEMLCSTLICRNASVFSDLRAPRLMDRGGFRRKSDSYYIFPGEEIREEECGMIEQTG